MTRHGRNSTASAVYTYHEKKKDSATSGYGSKTVRLGKDSIKDFDCCCLTLQLCRNPVTTPDGYLYDKEAILENLLHQKRENTKRMKAFEKQKTKQQAELEELATAEARSKVEKFLAAEKSIVSKPVDAFAPKRMEAPSISNMANIEPGRTHLPPSFTATSSSSSTFTSSATSSSSSAPSREAAKERRPKLPSFWIPTLTPQAKKSEIEKPDMKTYCPMSGTLLKVKHLTPVFFTLVADRDLKTATIVKQARYMCPVTHDVLGNSVPCAVLKPSGHAVTLECVDRLIRKNDMLCPITGKTLKDKDIIILQRGGTGFAGSGVALKATKAGAAMMV